MLLLIYEDTKGRRDWIKFPNKEYLTEFIELEDIKENTLEIYEIPYEKDKGGIKCALKRNIE